MQQPDPSRVSNRATIDALFIEQSASWRNRPPVRVEDLLARTPALRDDAEGLLDLIYHEVVLRERAGEAPTVEEYQARFPWLAGPLRIQLQVRALFRPGDSAREEHDSRSSPRAISPRLDGMDPPPPGYTIEGEIGRGGMGVVYRARQLALNRRVALKVVVAGQHAEPARLERLRIEAEAVARLQHPNIVQIFEVGEHGGCPFLVLEYVEGSNLARVFAGAPQAPRRVAALVESLARAVHHVHRQGIVHRDLKPANILVTTDGILKIADFGLAKILEGASSRTDSGAVLGTPSYMAPEQVTGKPSRVGPATDVYALGALLYEGLTGRPPFQAENPLATFQQVLSNEVVPPSRLLQRIPRDLETIALKCLEKEPQRRYADAAALADDLSRFLADRPIVARPSNRLELAGRWCRKNPALATASGLAAAALLGITIVSSLYSISSGRNARQMGQSAENLREALRISEEHRRQSELRLAEEYLERGRTLGDRGSGTEALLVLVRALEIAPRSEPGLQHAIRTHIGSFVDKLHRPSMVLDTEGQVTAQATSPDGTMIAAGRMDGAIVLWSSRTGARAFEFRDHQSRIWDLAFSPDGHTLCSGSGDGTARLWHLADGRWTVAVLRHGSPLRKVSLSADGSRVLTGAHDGSVRLWSVSTGGPTGVQVMHPGGLAGARFDPQGKTFVTYGGADSACLWDAATGQPLGPPLRHEHWVLSAAFSPNGRFVLTGSLDRTARLWERDNGKPVGAPCQHGNPIHVVAFSPSGEHFATVSFDTTARIWDTATTQPIGKPLPHELPVYAVAFSPDGSTLATGSDDQTVRLWDVGSGEPIGFPLRHAGQIWGVGFTPDGRLVSWGLDDPVRLWHLAQDRRARTTLRHQHPVTAVAYSPDGRMVVTGTSDRGGSRSQLQRWNAATYRPIGPAIPQPWGISTVAFSPDGKRFANGIVGFEFGQARVWDTETAEPVGPPVRHDRAVRALTFAPDGTSFLTASEDRTVRLWKVATGESVRVFPHEDYVTSLAITSNGKLLLTGSEDRLGLIWDMETGKVVGQPLRHQGALMGVALSRDGRTALTASVDHTAQLWNMSTQTPIGTPLRHSAWVAAAAFSPTGLLALTASADGTLQLWDTATQRPIGMPMRHESVVFAAAFSPDGKTVLSGSLDGTARFWPVPTPVDSTIERIVHFAQVVTGAELGESDVVRALDAPTWQRRWRRLEELGGSPLIP